MKRLLFLCALFIVLLLPALAFADGHVTWISQYDPALNEFPEGIAVDKVGNIFVGVQEELRKITPDGGESVFYEFPSGAGTVGLAVDASGNVYTCVFTPPPAYDPNLNGVWRISPDGEGVQLPGTAPIFLANALAFDSRGNLYVTSSWVPGTFTPPEGAIWRIPPNGVAELWLQDATFLGGLGQIPNYVPLGANGISFRHNALYVANTEKGHIVRIPVLPDGSPGEPSIVAQAPELLVIDGIALDVHGTIYAAIVGQDQIVSVDPFTGEVEVLAVASDGVDGPASLAFDTGMGEHKALFFTNYALPFEPESHPGVLRMEVGVPGLPLP